MKKTGLFNPAILLLIGWSFCAAIYGYVFYYAYISGEGKVTMMLLPLLAGVIFENWRLSGDWNAIHIKLLGALLIGLVAFLPGKNEIVYDFERHIEFWQYAFIFFFVAASAFYHEDRSIIPLGEGTTLIQTLALLYLCIERNWFDASGSFVTVLLVIMATASVYVLVHAFANFKLTYLHRLLLSLWSSLIMLVFASDHMSRVLWYNSFEAAQNESWFFIAIDYFLLGVALIYIFRNASMLWVYLPSRNNFYNKYHREEIKKVNGLHIARYASSQLPVSDALLIVICSGTVFYLNYHYAFIADHTLVWVQFWVLPFLIMARKEKWLKIGRIWK